MTIFRGILFVVGALTLLVGLLTSLGGEYRFGLSSLFLGGGLLLMATWAWPLATPVRNWVCFGVVAASFVVLGAWVPAVVVLLVLFVLSVAGGRFVLRGLSGKEIERVGPEAVMPKAAPLVAEFEAEGFRRVGGLRIRLPLFRKLVTSTVLAGPTGDRWAVVTDRVWEVASRFGERWLETTSSGLTPNVPAVLRQTMTDAPPARLVRAHQGAIEILAGRGLEADRLAEDEVVDAAQALEQHAIDLMSKISTARVAAMEARRGSEDPVLGDDDRSGRRIDAWLEPQPSVGS